MSSNCVLDSLQQWQEQRFVPDSNMRQKFDAYVTFESNWQSLEWRHFSSLASLKPKQILTP